MKNHKSGTYGDVYEIIYNYNKYSIKKYKLPYYNLGVYEDIIRDVFHYTSSYSILNLESIQDFPCKIMMECYDGDILDFINHNTCSMTIDNFKDFFNKILIQLYSIHSHGFLHSDIKLTNILYKYEKKYSICDYGLTEYYGFPLIKKMYQCTKGFRAPKFFTRCSVNLDMYSLGATIFYFITGLSSNFLNIITEADIDRYFSVISKYIEPKLLKNMLLNCCSSKQIIFSEALTENTNKNLWLSISKHISSVFPINIIKNKFNPASYVFKQLKIKNNRYYEYKYYEIYQKKYELEYLEDMYSNYHNHILQINNLNDDQIFIKNCILRCYMKSGFHIETLLFSFYLVNHFPITNNMKIESAKLFLNISSKILENNTLIKTVIDKTEIVSFEKTIMNSFLKREIIFTPSLFFIYYFLFKLAYHYPLIYINTLIDLESISLSLLIIYLFKPEIYQDKMTYSILSHDIILISLEFVLNLNINNKLFDILKKNSKIINQDMLRLLIENEDLYDYIIQHI
jgi:serine/threonine protein kinase